MIKNLIIFVQSIIYHEWPNLHFFNFVYMFSFFNIIKNQIIVVQLIIYREFNKRNCVGTFSLKLEFFYFFTITTSKGIDLLCLIISTNSIIETEKKKKLLSDMILILPKHLESSQIIPLGLIVLFVKSRHKKMSFIWFF